jgi:cytochrome o ubiquinol oxidase subunit 2
MLFFTGIILFLFLVMQVLQVLQFKEYISVLFPAGTIALKQRNLLFLIQALMLVIVIPVYVFTFIFSWKYRADNNKADYDPHLVDNWIAECFWWGIPLVMTVIVSIITWEKTHELDPYKSIASDKKPITIQAVALQWKWLFIYPEENIASMNYLQIPVGTPIKFEVTADAPMNSLWIPELGGQIYAMPAMRTELNLIATEAGDFRGSSANISGEGFAGMHFIAKASTEEAYRDWLKKAKEAKDSLSFQNYPELSAPSQNVTPQVYQLKTPKLFDEIMMQYTHPKKN